MVPGSGQEGHSHGPGSNAVAGGSAVSWMLREFELVDMLINQLELMQPGDRRRSLMALQYSLAAADLNQVTRASRSYIQYA
jgi:hypothetical protein